MKEKKLHIENYDSPLGLSDILKKVRELEIKSKKLTNHLFTGEYHSAFKGRGMSFKEVKEYSAGDDVRFIDWNVSARMGGTYSKLFEEERELTVYLLVDVSASNLLGTQLQTKKDLITQICAVLAFSALSNNDKVGLIFFSNKVEKYIPSKKGREHILYMVRELLLYQSVNKTTDIIQALQYLNSIAKQKSIVFLLSDFVDAGYENALKVAAKKHDVIGIKVYDQLDENLPDIGLLKVEDIETGMSNYIDTSDTMLRYKYHQQFLQIQADAVKAFKTAGADLIQISTEQDYVKLLQQFFIKRG
jgi:uncharacterized protein (DUF58 family)